MADAVKMSNLKNISSLAGDILSDAQTLVRQEVDLARVELATELEKGRRYSKMLAWKWSAISLALLLFSLSFVHFLSVEFEMPLWAAFASVALVSGIVAVVLSLLNKKQVPFRSEAGAFKNFKESLQCLTKQKS